ncbi:MAG: DUF4386 domain-containing protein [Candidatus Dormibacteraeota bacterium]|nr:DUF4386 domain-containing protein [Candidatus Dormibacteraeota bacterium]
MGTTGSPLICGFIGTLATALLAVGIYRTVRPVDANLALTAMLFRIVETATGAVGGGQCLRDPPGLTDGEPLQCA